MGSGATAPSPENHLPTKSISSISIFGTTMEGRPNTALSWEAPTLCNGTATIPCCPKWLNYRTSPPGCGGNMGVDARWRSDYILWVELFVLMNLAFLSVDIFLAHS